MERAKLVGMGACKIELVISVCLVYLFFLLSMCNCGDYSLEIQRSI